jgi:hypothetical protein
MTTKPNTHFQTGVCGTTTGIVKSFSTQSKLGQFQAAPFYRLWFEGVQMLALCAMIAVAIYFLP